MTHDEINNSNRLTALEFKVMWLENELKELRKDILRAKIIPMNINPTMIMDAHDDLA